MLENEELVVQRRKVNNVSRGVPWIGEGLVRGGNHEFFIPCLHTFWGGTIYTSCVR